MLQPTGTVAVTLFALALAGVTLPPGTAAADAEAEAKQKKAGEYFSRGELLFEAEEYAKAAAAFSLAYELAPHPSVLANIALSYERAGDLPPAIEHWQRYVESVEDPGERAQVEKRLTRLRKQVGELTIECPQASCQIRIDGVDQGTAPLTVILTAGTHRVEAYSGETKLAALDTRVEGEEHSRVELFAQEQAAVEEEAETVVEEEPVGLSMIEMISRQLDFTRWFPDMLTAQVDGDVRAPRKEEN